jgi:nucleoside-diphosphate-sugar epimerase
MKRALITGSSGFIGQKLVSAIDKEKYSIHVISRNREPGLETTICDFQFNLIPDDVMNGTDIVFHLAGVAHDSIMHYEEYFEINVKASSRLAELAAISGVKRFIYISSVKSGGVGDNGLCITELEQVEPEGAYGRTKLKAELTLLEIGHRTGMHVTIIRPSLVYGPNAKGNLRQMMSGISNGWFPPLPKINNKRSMVHIDDVVRAILFVATSDKTKGEIFNVTDGEPHSSREIYEVMCTILGKPIPRWSLPKFLFELPGYFSPNLKYKLGKLFGDECYSSDKLQSIGFKTKRTLKEMNETFF